MSHRRVSLLFALCTAPLVVQPITAAQAQPPTAAEQPAQALPPRRLSTGIPPGVKALRDVEYARVGELPLTLDIYLPDAPAPAKPAKENRPVIVWIHGGGWSAGSKANCPAAVFVPAGFAAVSIDYRLTPLAPFPAQIHDCKAAVRWVRAHAAEYGFDPDHVGVWGGSAGGHLAALLGTSGGDKELEGTVGGNLDQSSAVQAVCDWFGPTDIVKLAHADGSPAEKPVDPAAPANEAAGPLDSLVGGPIHDHLDLARKASPMNFISKDDPPVLIMHGDKDSLVPISQSEMFNDALKAAGVDVKMHVVKGAGHGFRGPAEIQMVGDFFREKLMPKPAP